MCSSVIIERKRAGWVTHALVAACVSLAACSSDDSGSRNEPPPVSAGQRMDASVDGGERPRRDASMNADDDAGEDAWRDAAAELAGVGPGMHVIVGDQPLAESTDNYLFELARIAVQGNFADGSKVTVQFDAAVGDSLCSAGAQVQYEDARGTWLADAQRGDCRVHVTAFTPTPGAPVAGDFEAMMQRTGGEDAELVRIAGHFEVGYP